MSNDKIATGPSLPAKSGFGLLVAKNAAENPCRQTDTISKSNRYDLQSYSTGGEESRRKLPAADGE
ncbi:MAG: hypothetical protein ABSG59_24760 [Verrucomicrobiota bacterium]